MNALLKLTFIDFKLYLRNGIAAFFTLVFPLLMMLLFGSMYGNTPTPFMGGHGTVEMMVPGYMAAMVIGTTGLLSLPMDLAARRQSGVLRRMRAAPVQPALVLGSQLLVNLVVSLLSAAVLVITAMVVFHMKLTSNLLPLLLGFVISCASMYALGFVIASLVRSASAARAVSMAVFYPMMFLCGGTIPLVFMPDVIKTASKFIPLTYSVNLLQDLWFGEGWNPTNLLVLAGVLVVGMLISLRTFRWE